METRLLCRKMVTTQQKGFVGGYFCCIHFLPNKSVISCVCVSAVRQLYSVAVCAKQEILRIHVHHFFTFLCSTCFQFSHVLTGPQWSCALCSGRPPSRGA